MKWVKIAPDRFLQRRDDIQVLWIKDFLNTDTKFRGAVIESNEEWKEFSKSCFLPWYKNSPLWSSPNNENYSLQEYAKEYSEDKLFIIKEGEEMLMLSVYHVALGKRLLVDGCHRAVALEIAVNKGTKIKPVSILECFGTQLHGVFYADFTNMIADTLQTRVSS